jgi:hypothetical protein
MRLLAIVDLWAPAVRYKVILWHRSADVAHSPHPDPAPVCPVTTSDVRISVFGLPLRRWPGVARGQLVECPDAALQHRRKKALRS